MASPYHSVSTHLNNTFRHQKEGNERAHVLTHRLKFLQQLEQRETQKSHRAQALAYRILQKRTDLATRRKALYEQRKQQEDALLAVKHQHLAKRSLNQTRRKRSQERALVIRKQQAHSLRAEKLYRKAFTPCKLRNPSELLLSQTVERTRPGNEEHNANELKGWIADLERQEVELMMQLEQAKQLRTKQEKQLEFIQNNKHINDMDEVELFNIQ